MSYLIRSAATLIIAFAWLHADAIAHSPADFLEVVHVTPSLKIEHGVELKSNVDASRGMTNLSGPEFFSRSVACLDRPAKKVPAYLNWFRIVDPQQVESRRVDVLDMVRGGNNKTLEIGQAEYLLSPAQLISTGAPDPVPEGLDLYKAYRVTESDSLAREIEISTSVTSTIRKLGKPLFVCLPVQQWHHEEHISATHPNDCFVVYGLDEVANEEEFSTIDQFGLNSLQGDRSQWICVRAAFLRIKNSE